MVFYRTLKTALQFTKRNFGAPAHGHVKRVRKQAEPEVDVEIAWSSVIYRSFFFIGYVVGPVYILNGGLADPPPYVPTGQTSAHGHGNAHAHAH